MGKTMITIFDTTLRDGEQTPGVCLNGFEKLEIAQALAKAKVDVIEAGFPIASPGDLQAVQMIAAQVHGPIIAALARANQKDIDCAWQGIAKSERPRIHTFIATSDIHLKYKLNMTRDQVLAQTSEAVRYAKKFTNDVEFSAEDASRSDWDYLCKIVTAAIAAGATVINIPDTVGYTMPDEFVRLIRYVRDNVVNIEKAQISVHCHDDLGMAVANSLAAIAAGVTQIECAVNGLGERAGNASLEELVMAIRTRGDYYQAQTNIDTRQIYRMSRLVSTLTGIVVPPNKAVIGDNAFAHESGIHQHGVLNNSSTYEIMEPEVIGINRNSLVLGKHSGRHALEERLKSLGYELDSEAIGVLFIKFKALADRKKVIFDRDIEALVIEKLAAYTESFRLMDHHISSGNQSMSTASVRLETAEGSILEEASCGEGPVDAMFQAIEKAIGIEVHLKDYQLKAITSGEDALGEANVWVECENQVFNGRGLSTDVIEASAKAYLNAINRMLAACGYPAADKKAEGLG